MNIVHAMWLFVASLLSLIGISFCIDCNHEATVSSITVSSSLNSTYGKENIGSSSDRPWVGGSNSSNWVSLEFPRPISLKSIHITGGKVDLYNNNTLVECHIDRFVLHYKSKSGGEWVRDKKYKDVSGDYKNDLDITDSVTSINITIKTYVKCPAIKMIKLFACGVCTQLTSTDEQMSTCTKDMQQCTLTCKPGLQASSSSNNVVKTCQLDGSWSGPDLTCEDVNECKIYNNACGDNETCTNVYKSYLCFCKPGYAGRPNCKDINECASADSNTCHKTLAKCINTVGSYTCRCSQGYTGDGRRCTDIDECKDDALNACHKTRAKCENSGGAYYCRCNQGYTGDGVQCTDIDECRDDALNVCHKTRAECKNTDGSYNCQCKPGFTGNGMKCTDVNECENGGCPKYANCTNTVGSFKCECKEGFLGKDCEGNPVVITSTFTDKTLRYGEKLKEDCKAQGLPTPTIKWNIPTGNVSGSVLEISSLTLNHNGDYTCIASNADTFSKKKFAVVVIGTPTSVPKATITKTTATSIHISWRKPSDEGASRIRGYRVFYEVLGDSRDKKRVNASELSAVISNLMPNKQYVISVVAINKQGMSEMENYVNVFTLASKPDKPHELEMESSSTSSSSVKIQLKKLDHDHTTELRVQVIVEKVPERSKRNTAVPGIIPAYDKADCEGNSECRYVTAEVKNNETDFVVGDGKMYGKYRNAELEPATAYKISVRGVSYNEEKKENFGDLSEPLQVSTTEKLGTPGPESDGNVIGIAVGLTVLFIVLIVLVLLAVIYFRSKRRPKVVEIDPETGEKKGRKKNVNSELLPLTKSRPGKRKSGQVEDGLPDPNHPPVATAGFAKYVGKLHKSDDRGFMIQYNTLETSQTYTSEVATIPENKEKNRYANIVAYDVSRVHLKQIDDDDNSSYINANLVDGYNSANAYIATQGPLPETFNDFWRMVWERNCSSIVMLTNLQERHKLKCHKYWPEESETYGEITVTATRKEQYADYVIRTFLLKMDETEEEREIKQFHFTVWPDHGVPEYPTAILAFQRRVRAYSTRDSGPLAVHCSAGVGRSGTFIVIDCMLARIQNEQAIDIYNYVRYLRTRRMFMVQTEEQYVFCHDALLESILCGNTQMAAHNLRIEMNRLRQKDATTKLTGFESEFKILSKVSPSLPKESFVVASYPQNASKNRYNDILASDHGRVMLGEDDDKEDGPYINAVYVDGYKQQNAFILTQAPLKETIKDLWQMLYEKRSACVLLLADLTKEEGDFPQFWPEEGSEEYDTYMVELVSDASKGDTGSEDQFHLEKLNGEIVEKKFRLTKAEDKSLVVKLFQHLSWTETSVPTDISAIISLIQRIEKWQQRSGNGPITVICNDGQGRSGTFAALCSVLERVKTEQVVDVFQTIKALRIQRPGLVKHVDQYQFIHFGVQEYLDSFSDYANFK